MQERRAEERIRKVTRAKMSDIERTLGIMQAELYKLLTNYMYLSREKLTVFVDVTNDGEYIFNLRAVTDRFIGTGKYL